MITISWLFVLCLVLQTGSTPNDVYAHFPAYEIDTKDNVYIPSVLYMIVTGAAKRNRAEVLHRTIGQHVDASDKMVFISDEESSVLPMHKVISIPNGTAELRAYKMSQLKWVQGIILSYSLQPFDWLIFLDDDTFIILDSFKAILSAYNPSESLIIGKKGVDCHLICGGAGFAISRELLKRFHSRLKDLEQHFDDALRRAENYQSDVILSHYVVNRGLGKLIHSPRLKNFPPAGSLLWHNNHNITPPAIASFHRIDPEEYVALYKHYYVKA